ncbi:hypothetical protein HWQ18_07020 [Enterobacter ludwigii]|uniref:hypothetical protein n=1 Tax=Enterobacter ludwigii TaxID=299767 RepID=UPI00159C1F80|nr:hypothetical protein [Enterobacter ludwigii]QLA06272.1 hypothetical protein HWQ18_07020 [Enterobacter ludwigii]
MKSLYALIAELSLTACQVKNPESNANPPQTLMLKVPATDSASTTVQKSSASVPLTDDVLKDCYSKINELKHFDRKRANAYYSTLSKTVKAKTEARASEEYLSKEALDYILYNYNQNVEVICAGGSQKLDKQILTIALKSYG